MLKQTEFKISDGSTVLDNVFCQWIFNTIDILMASNPWRKEGVHLSSFSHASHGSKHTTKTARCLVEEHYLFLRHAPGRGIWCLPPSPVHSAQGHPRRNRCALAAGIIWVRISALEIRFLLSHRAIKDHHRLSPPVLSSVFQRVAWCTCRTRVDRG